MMTFLPYPDMLESLVALDDKRLAAMRRESLIMFNAITENKKGWRNHPITVMFRNNLNALAAYFNYAQTEWLGRGFVNNLPFLSIKDEGRGATDFLVPWWWGWRALHESHQATLLRKDNEYYSILGFSADLLQDVIYAERALAKDGVTTYLCIDAALYRSQQAKYPPRGERWYSDAKQALW